MTTSIIQGDALTELRKLPSDHFHCVVTSPPYFGLRDYGTGAWDGGDPACDHLASIGGGFKASTLGPNGIGLGDVVAEDQVIRRRQQFRDVCGKCGARRIDQQIGLEATPEEWCTLLVEVFREVRRVLRPDGTLWLNCGDSYAGPKGNTAMTGGRSDPDRGIAMFGDIGRNQKVPTGLKQKDLIGQPWMLAFALRADGWWLRSEIIWAKPNPMPESVRDRPTKAHEQLFMLTKSPRYFYDAEAVREPNTDSSWATAKRANGGTEEQGPKAETFKPYDLQGTHRNPAGRNMRSVWTIATDPLPSVEVDGEKLDHYASFPIELARRCILAGTSAKGCCPECGAPWARLVETGESSWEARKAAGHDPRGYHVGNTQDHHAGAPSIRPFTERKLEGGLGWVAERKTTGWRPTCSCLPGAGTDPIPCRVLDPFGGSGRTALACEELGRDCTLIELSPASCAMARAQLERAKARRMIGDGERVPVAEGQLRLL